MKDYVHSGQIFPSFQGHLLFSLIVTVFTHDAQPEPLVPDFFPLKSSCGPLTPFKITIGIFKIARGGNY